MSTERIIIKNGLIKDPESNEFVTRLTVHSNWSVPWNVSIENNNIVCVAEKIYNSGPEKIEKTFPLEDGLLGLSGGRISQRYAYFRKEAFQNLLVKYGINAVNNNFDGEWIGWITAYNDSEPSVLFTDGDIGLITEDISTSSISVKVSIEDATWMIKSSPINGNRILFIPKGLNAMHLNIPESCAENWCKKISGGPVIRSFKNERSHK